MIKLSRFMGYYVSLPLMVNKDIYRDIRGTAAQIISKSANYHKGKFIILLMQIQHEQNAEDTPFEIIHNARSSRASRSRKSSTHIIEKDKPKHKLKKHRKLTMNPESSFCQEIKEIEQLRSKKFKSPGSEKGEIKEEMMDFEDLLELEGPKRIQSQKEMQLEAGICYGTVTEKELDSDFDLSGTPNYVCIDPQMLQ